MRCAYIRRKHKGEAAYRQHSPPYTGFLRNPSTGPRIHRKGWAPPRHRRRQHLTRGPRPRGAAHDHDRGQRRRLSPRRPPEPVGPRLVADWLRSSGSRAMRWNRLDCFLWMPRSSSDTASLALSPPRPPVTAGSIRPSWRSARPGRRRRRFPNSWGQRRPVGCGNVIPEAPSYPPTPPGRG